MSAVTTQMVNEMITAAAQQPQRLSRIQAIVDMKRAGLPKELKFAHPQGLTRGEVTERKRYAER